MARVISVQADPITISIANLNNLSAMPGAAPTLFGTLMNNTSEVLFVNSSGGSHNHNVPPDTNIVLDAIFHIRPDLTTYTLQSGQTTALIPLLTLFINPFAPVPSLTSGSIDLCGGSGPSACNSLGQAFYTIAIGTPATTPEPATLLLIGTGFVFGFLKRRTS
jgi:hypothetical protein